MRKMPNRHVLELVEMGLGNTRVDNGTYLSVPSHGIPITLL